MTVSKSLKLATYRAYRAMLDRTCNPKCKSYYRYGAIGRTVCKRWMKGFEFFLQDLGYKPDPKLSLERIDNTKGYSPNNCKWATWEEQCRNRSDTRIIEYRGKRLVLKDAAKEFGIEYSTLKSRLNRGWAVKRAIETPEEKCGRNYLIELEHGGIKDTLEGWSKRLGVPSGTIRSRIRKGLPIEKILASSRWAKDSMHTFCSITLPSSEWGRRAGISRQAFVLRIRRGYSMREALITPQGRHR